MRNTDHHAAWLQETTAAAADARSRLRSRFLLLLAGFVIIWAFGEGVALWGHLPEEIPTHFGLSGKPDAWSSKSIFSVFMLPITATVLLLLFAVFVSVRFNPRYINVPRKEFFLTLPPALQDHVIAPIREGMAWLGASIAIGFCLMCRQSWDVALERRSAMSPSLMPIAIVIGTAAVIIGTVHLYRRIRNLEKAS